VKRVRLDSLLSQRHLFTSRSRAAASVRAGEVLLLPGRRRADKPGQIVPEDIELEVAPAPAYASRGGIKLANALDRLGIDAAGRHAADVGASTGGFTDCLLQRGVAHVVAVDVADGELDPRLRDDPRVTVLERRNARSLRSQELPYFPELIAIDVSFISLTKILPAVLACAAAQFDCLALVKPQFEVGRARIGKAGVVREPVWRREALLGVARAAVGLGESVRGFAPSGLPGRKGNRETFVWLAESARGGCGDLAAVVMEMEP